MFDIYLASVVASLSFSVLAADLKPYIDFSRIGII